LLTSSTPNRIAAISLTIAAFNFGSFTPIVVPWLSQTANFTKIEIGLLLASIGASYALSQFITSYALKKSSKNLIVYAGIQCGLLVSLLSTLILS
jgi:sugar phosphate permease